MNARFVIDETSFDLNGLQIDEAREVIETLLDHIEKVDEQHRVCFDDEFMHRPLLAHMTFWLLFDENNGLGLNRGHVERATAAFNNMSRWYDLEQPFPPDIEVRIDGGPTETTASVAWSHAQATTGLDAVACLSSSHRRRNGLTPVDLNGSIEEVWFVTNTADIEGYFRHLIVKHCNTPEEISRLATSAFPNLQFVENCFNGIKSMSKPCRQLAPTIVQHLSAFSDHGKRIFMGNWQQAPAEFGALHVNISDENGNTKKDSKAAHERIRSFDGVDREFMWHSKFEQHQDRIHICPDKVSQGEDIIVGIFCLHLS